MRHIMNKNGMCYETFIAGLRRDCTGIIKWAASSEFVTYRLCEQRRFRRACASAQSRQNHRCSLIQAVSQEEPSDRKPDPWPLWMAGHAHLKFVITECSKTQIHLTRHKCFPEKEQKTKKTKKKKKKNNNKNKNKNKKTNNKTSFWYILHGNLNWWNRIKAKQRFLVCDFRYWRQRDVRLSQIRLKHTNHICQ